MAVECIVTKVKTEKYFKGCEVLISENKLLSALSKRHYEEEDSTHSKISYIKASETLLQILEISKKKPVPSLFLTGIERKHMNSACTFVKLLMDWKFNYKEFYKALCASPHLPLEFLFRLHLLGIMSLDTYLSELQNQPEKISVFCKTVVHLCCNQCRNSEFKHWLTSGIVAYVVNKVFMNEDPEICCPTYPALKKICNLVLSCILKRLVKLMDEKPQRYSICSLSLLWGNPSMEDSTLQSFCVYVLEFIIQYNSIFEGYQAILEQHNWIYKNVDVNCVAFIKKVISVAEIKTMLPIIQRVIESEKQNWKLLLIILSIYMSYSSEAAANILDISDNFMSEAFEKFDEKLLLQSFVIARHATSFEHSNSQLAYSQWFQKSFGDPATSCAKDIKSFEFFMKFLTDLVPFEQEQHLKVHIEKPPYAVSGCRHLYTDYVSLVKTRLSELRPQTSADVVLNKMLASFEATGKVPSAILEISMLQKYEYQNIFLPNLLTPRVLPDIPDVKMKFVQALKACGKIPKDLFEKYEEACREEAKRSLNAQPMDVDIQENDGGVAELCLEFVFHIQDSKSRLSYMASLRKYLTEFRRKLLVALAQITKPACPMPVILSELTVDGSIKKVIREVIDCYCCFQSEWFGMSSENPLLWDLANDMQTYYDLHDVLYIVLWEQIKSQVLETALIGLSSLLLRISMLCPPYPLVQTRLNSSDQNSLADFVFRELPLTTSDEINYFCKFSYSYLKLIFHRNIYPKCESLASFTLPPFIPEVLIKKFRFCAVRSLPQLRGKDIQNVTGLHQEIPGIFLSPHFKRLSSMVKISFSDWLMLESKILPERDSLTVEERCEYTQWCIQNLCELDSSSEKSSSNSKTEHSRNMLFRLLLSKYSQIPCAKELTLVLKDLVGVCSKSQVVVAVPSMRWIFKEFYAVINCHKGLKLYDLLVYSTIKNFTRLICDLPSFLLFQDIPLRTCRTFEPTELKNIINDWIRLYNGREIFLPPAFTNHILKSLLLLLICSEDVINFQRISKVIEVFLNECPLFTLSVMKHWSTLKSNLPRVLPKHENYLCIILKDINAATTQITKYFSGEPVTNVSVKQLKNWALGYLVMKTRIECSSILPYPAEKFVNSEVVACAVQFDVALSIALNREDVPVPVNLIKAIRYSVEHKQGSYLCPKGYKDTPLKEVFSPSVWYHFPAGCLKLLLVTFEESEIITVDEGILCHWISLVLMNLHECNKRYIDRNSVNQWYHSHINDEKICKMRYGILDLFFIQQATSAVQNILVSVPLSCIKKIPQEVIENCDDYVKCFLHQEVEQ